LLKIALKKQIILSTLLRAEIEFSGRTNVSTVFPAWHQVKFGWTESLKKTWKQKQKQKKRKLFNIFMCDEWKSPCCSCEYVITFSRTFSNCCISRPLRLRVWGLWKMDVHQWTARAFDPATEKMGRGCSRYFFGYGGWW
jgi:hypothetical protein